MALRSSKYCKRYEYHSVDLQNPIIIPANNRSQNKNGYKFVVDSSNESYPMDWYNAYFDLENYENGQYGL